MKNVFIKIIFFFFILLGLSCKNVLDPNAPLKERYVLTGIMRSDTTLQIVTVTHTYRPSGSNTDPNSYTTAPYILGAEVNLWYKEKLYEFRDTVLTRIDTSRYNEPVHCYYVNNLKPNSNEYIDIEALLPNGLLLQSTTKTPAADSLTFFDSASDKLVSNQKFAKNITIKWKPFDRVLYVPKVEITYYKSGDLTKHFKEVPLLYFDDNGKSTPVFPKATSASAMTIDFKTITQALNEIAAGDAKKNYSISDIKITVITYDPFLSAYYSSIQPAANGFVVTLDEPDYTNILGGYGIFGSYIKRSFKVNFDLQFLKDLGF